MIDALGARRGIVCLVGGLVGIGFGVGALIEIVDVVPEIVMQHP